MQEEAEALAKGTVAVVLAGGKGTRLGVLTRHDCKPALPFGAAYRNIDFSLANCVNSGIRRIGVATQHKPESLLRHLDRVWCQRAEAGRLVAAWPAEQRAPGDGYSGTADAVFRNLDEIEALRARYVLVLAGDHVYHMDYRPMLAAHAARGADVTVGCVDVEIEQAHRFGIVSADGAGRIERFVEKPQTRDSLPPGDRVLASMGIYLFDARFLATALRRDAASFASSHDFGHDVLPSSIAAARAFAYRFRSPDGARAAYWRDVGTPAAYWRANLELLEPSAALRLDDPRWPMPAAQRAPTLTARYDVAAREPSLIGDACVVEGTVRRSVLFTDVRVGRGALVDRSVVLPGAMIGRDCVLRGVIVEGDCHVPSGTIVDPTERHDGALAPEFPAIVTAERFARPRSGPRRAGALPARRTQPLASNGP
jgi:glucose-1-phosphate adenylyltransferase